MINLLYFSIMQLCYSNLMYLCWVNLINSLIYYVCTQPNLIVSGNLKKLPDLLYDSGIQRNIIYFRITLIKIVQSESVFILTKCSTLLHYMVTHSNLKDSIIAM